MHILGPYPTYHKPSSEFFLLVIIFLSSKTCIGFFLYLLCLCRDYLFLHLFHSDCSCLLEPLMIATLKFLLDNSNICVILVLASVDFLFSFELRFS